MNYKGKKVLLLDAYARQTLPMLRGFKKLGCNVTVACYSKLDVGYASNVPDHKVILDCSKDDHAGQYRIVKKMIESGEYDMVVPMNDYAAIYLSEHKEYLSQFAYIAVNDWSVFKYAINKINTMRLCEDNSIPAPLTVFAQSKEEILNNDRLRFPAVVKPQTACGSIGFNIVNDAKHLEKVIDSSGSVNGPIFVQEYIPQNGAQYGAEAFRTRNGEFSFILIDKKPRWFPLDGGSPTINVTIHDEELTEITKNLLNAMNWVGYANIDFVIDSRNDQPKVLEINGRISAAVSLDEYAGINVAQLICEDAFGGAKTIYEDYKDDIKVSCVLTEILWFLKSKDRWNTEPSIFSRKNTKDVIFRMSDPKPFIAFCIQSAKNYRHAMQQRKRG